MFLLDEAELKLASDLIDVSRICVGRGDIPAVDFQLEVEYANATPTFVNSPVEILPEMHGDLSRWVRAAAYAMLHP